MNVLGSAYTKCYQSMYKNFIDSLLEIFTKTMKIQSLKCQDITLTEWDDRMTMTEDLYVLGLTYQGRFKYMEMQQIYKIYNPLRSALLGLDQQFDRTTCDHLFEKLQMYT